MCSKSSHFPFELLKCLLQLLFSLLRNVSEQLTALLDQVFFEEDRKLDLESSTNFFDGGSNQDDI